MMFTITRLLLLLVIAAYLIILIILLAKEILLLAQIKLITLRYQSPISIFLYINISLVYNLGLIVYVFLLIVSTIILRIFIAIKSLEIVDIIEQLSEYFLAFDIGNEYDNNITEPINLENTPIKFNMSEANQESDINIIGVSETRDNPTIRSGIFDNSYENIIFNFKNQGLFSYSCKINKDPSLAQNIKWTIILKPYLDSWLYNLGTADVNTYFEPVKICHIYEYTCIEAQRPSGLNTFHRTLCDASVTLKNHGEVHSYDRLVLSRNGKVLTVDSFHFDDTLPGNMQVHEQVGKMLKDKEI